ncbi:hypothetical protein SAMN05216526_0345 [Ectothiorhodosinus mongolicus]|uniref:Predicted 3'-5' exonuclease PolB-like domain-containing protein n=1 Tax=Ectothiorhodosinus mongolicus TaxID=233100 RepID=A0A1R3VMU9_9GAMM|nr:3'-5' exonuclease [Ectothiorhodosinus mongolicus]SIT65889.1 hypothetical protein SAMN05216526_0345 [Ectothiorhodosinus mongolicus]
MSLSFATPVMVFDIETIPDIEGGTRLYDLKGLEPAAAAKSMFQMRLQKTGREFLPHHLQRICAISVVLATREHIKVWSLGDESSDEAELIQRFYDGLERYSPTLVTWNGGGFDLPVLHYRTLRHGIAAPRYWEMGDEDKAFRYNNYLSRYHWRHVDLMDVLAGFSPRANAPLDEIATLLGFPGKMGMDGSKVWEAWLAGDLAGIRAYCETDVLNTYLVYLRFEAMRGRLGEAALSGELQRLKDWLENAEGEHFQQFLKSWQG